MRKVRPQDLPALFAVWNARQTLYFPADTDKGAVFLPWREDLTLSPALHTTRSVKDFFFPQTETMMAFEVKGKKIEIIDCRKEAEDFVLFGLRACDEAAVRILDRVFLSEPVDSYYENRRAHGILVTVACRRPAETCFCTTFGIDPAEPLGDVRVYPADDAWYLEALTEKGEALLAQGGDLCPWVADAAPVEEEKNALRKKMAALPLAGLTTEGFGSGKTQELFDSPVWQKLAATCLGCGTCTFVCPTCQCYDIQDFDTGHGIRRFRCWDSCMYSEFTKMAGGQPRVSQTERFRQRFMHKLVYFPENNGEIFGCVGCGRCLVSCPIHMNIVKVMKELGKEKTNDGSDL